MNGWLLAWGLGWPVFSFIVFCLGKHYGERRTLTRYNDYTNRGDFAVEYDTHGLRSIRCAPSKALPRAWTVKR